MFVSLCITFVLATFSASAAHSHHKRGLANVYTKCTVPNTVALTFDDGPYIYMEDVSNALHAAGGKGTFFLNGNNYGCIYSDENIRRIRLAYEQGHQIASHTWSHAHLNTLNWHEVHHELKELDQALERIIGVKPAFVRPPFGEYNDQVRSAAALRGQSIVLWDFDSADSAGAGVTEMINSYSNIIVQRPSNILALNHDTYQQFSQLVLPQAIQILKLAGYELVTVAECLGQKPYQFVGKPQVKNALWKC